MQINDTHQQYGIISKILHWSIGILFLFQFLKVFDRWNNKENFITSNIPPWHGSIGVLLMGLVLARIIWLLVQWKNRDHSDKLVTYGHLALYVFMFLAPLSAICLSLSKGRSVGIFGTEIIAKGEALTQVAWFGQLHSPIALSLIVLVLGHVAMSIFHNIRSPEKATVSKML